MTDTLLIGSGNRGKAAELAELLVGMPWDVKGLGDYPEVPEPVEDGETFEANAAKKALYFAHQFSVACLADDSGLVVDALGGVPGVYSARYSGEGATDLTNNAKLLDALRDTPEPERSARFVCCAAFVLPGQEPHLELGTVEGHIAFEQLGPRGFGYDPLFVPEGHDRSFGQMDSAQKLALSHRGHALRKMRTYLESLR